MKPLYQAANLVEAHMVLNLIQQQGLTGRVDGEYLQGGIGELPAAGLIRVMVAEDDYALARNIVDRWDAAQPAQELASTKADEVREISKKGNGLLIFLAGVAVGASCALILR